MPDERHEWMDELNRLELLLPPLDPPVACRRCLRPLPLSKRQYGTCYQCGFEHPPGLKPLAAATYGASGTRPWDFFVSTKYKLCKAVHLPERETAFAAALSVTAESHAPRFVDPDGDHVTVLVPSGEGLIERCLTRLTQEGWPPFEVYDVLEADPEKPRQTGLDSDGRREAARDKYSCGSDVEGLHVLLLDDAFTSGSTMHDAARAVREAGAASVSGLVYARRIYPEGMAIYREEREGA